MQTERNLLIEAYQGAGAPFLASRILLAMAPDAEVQAHSHPAVRDHFAREVRSLCGDAVLAELVNDMAAKALQLMKPDTGEQGT